MYIVFLGKFCFQWLLTDFLGFLKDWEDQVAAIPGLDPKTRQSMCLSKETIEGFRITGRRVNQMLI
jgi:hypothetical protein